MTTTHRIETAPGRFVGWESHGSGPGLAVLHGAARAGQHYRRLAHGLSDRFAVHLVDRNGRGLSLPRDDAPGLAGQVADVAAVFDATGAKFLFGHSAGGMVALAAAPSVRPERLVVYEPAVSIDHSIPSGQADDLRRELAGPDPARGMVHFAKDVGAVPAWAPTGPTALFFRMFLSGPGGRELSELVPLVLPDIEMIEADDGPASRFAAITAPALVMWGDRSPPFLVDAARKVVAAIPNGKGLQLPGQRHDAPDFFAAGLIARHIAQFLGA